MSDYRMLTLEDRCILEAVHGWSIEEIEELEDYLWNNTRQGVAMQASDAFKALWQPVFELLKKPITKLVRKIIGKKNEI